MGTNRSGHAKGGSYNDMAEGWCVAIALVIMMFVGYAIAEYRHKDYFTLAVQYGCGQMDIEGNFEWKKANTKGGE